MNTVQLIGRLTKDVDTRKAGETSVANFTLAVDRPMSKEKAADFIRCVCFGKTAEVAEKYLSKGRQVGVVGRIQTGSYEDKDGKKVYTTDVVVERLEFVGGKKEDAPANATTNATNAGLAAETDEDFDEDCDY